MENANPPIVLVFAGNDPSGGAGITADIEAIASHGGHALPVITCLTVQDTCGLSSLAPIDSQLVIQQARTVLEDLPVDAIKIGLTGSADNIQAIYEVIVDYPDIPVILDPVLNAGGNDAELVDEDMLDLLFELLIPETTILTPNVHEVMQLAPEADSPHAAALALLDIGCEYVLLTGTHENSEEVINRLYGDGRELKQYPWQRLKPNYHGSGCTLAAAIACLLAQQEDIYSALELAQNYTWQSLREGYRLGMGQYHPNRLFWASSDDTP